MHSEFNNKEPEYNRLSTLRRDQFEVNQVIREIVAALDSVDEFFHHLGGAEIRVGRKSEIDNGFDIDAIVHDVTSIHSTAPRI